jgi:integrase
MFLTYLMTPPRLTRYENGRHDLCRPKTPFGSKMPKLSQSLIEHTPHPSHGQAFIRDTELPGFALRVTKGCKTFILEKRVQGRMRRLTLGRLGVLTVDAARERARSLLGDIERGRVPEQAHKKPTFGKLAELYIERHARHKKSARNDQAVLRNHLSHWRPKRLADITAGEVALLHGRIGQTTPYQANRVVALLRKMFNLALGWGLFAGRNPAAGVTLHKEHKRYRFLQPDELPRLFHALKEETNEPARVAFLTALFTGARPAAVLAMRWQDLGDLDRETLVWRIPQQHGRPPEVIPLVSPLSEAIKQLPRREPNPYVFAGHGRSEHLVNLKHAWQRIRVKAQIRDVRIADLRRTFVAWLAAGGESLTLMGQILDHAGVAAAQRYAGAYLDPIREALERSAKRMLISGKIGPAFAKSAAASTISGGNPLQILTAPEGSLKKPETA